MQFAKRMRWTIGLIFVLFGFFTTGCATDRSVIDNAQQMNTSLRPATLKDSQINSYLQQVGNRIIAAAKECHDEHLGPDSHFKEDSSWMFSKGMQFHMVNSNTLNAFTTGGTHMYIYRKLFDTCKSEDELAAVMAHEYAHVYCRHVQQGMNRQMAMLGAAGLAGVAGYALGGKEHGGTYAQAGAGAALIGGQFVGMGFTRGDEAQADEWGYEFYTRAGWDPKHFGDFFKRMIEMGYDKTPEALSDHPSLASRAQKADERSRKMSAQAQSWRRPNIADDAQFASLQREADRASRGMPTDQQLASAQKVLAALPRSCLTPVMQPDQKEAQEELLREAEKKQTQQQRAR